MASLASAVAAVLGASDHRQALADGVPIRHRSSHLAACIHRRYEAHAVDVHRLHDEHPDWDAQRIADAVDDAPRSAPHTAPVRPSCEACDGSTQVFDEATQTASDCPTCKPPSHLKAVS